MRPPWIVGKVGGLALVLVLSACGGGGEDSEDAQESPSATPSATPSPTETAEVEEVVAPERPASKDTAKGRKAFARFVIDTWGYALAENDPEPVLSLSPGKKQLCKGCPELRKELTKRRKQGWYVDFPGAKVQGMKLGPGPEDGQVLATARVVIPPSRSYFDDGSFRNDNDRHRGTFEVLMRREGKKFVLLGFRLA